MSLSKMAAYQDVVAPYKWPVSFFSWGITLLFIPLNNFKAKIVRLEMISTSIIYQSVFQLHANLDTTCLCFTRYVPRQAHVESRGKFLLSIFLPLHPPLFLSLLILQCVVKTQSCINLTKFVTDLRCLPVPMQSKAADTA